MLDTSIKEQLVQYIKLLESDIVIKLSVSNDDTSLKMQELVEEISAMSDKISVVNETLTRTPSFSINSDTCKDSVVFAGIPLGHEFTSLVLAILQVSGRKPKIEDSLIERISKIEGNLNFETYISLDCHNCPDVVQSLNMMSVINTNITHVMIEGSAFKNEIDSKNIMAVPSIYLNGEHFDSGRMSLEEILLKLGESNVDQDLDNKDIFDVLVIGGGPAGASSAIYSARKGLRTGIVAENFGGQIMETVGIENLISVPYTEGPKLAADLETHIKEYDVDIMKHLRVKEISKGENIDIFLENGQALQSKSVIISTGAKWRNLGVPGEVEFKNKGVAYCPHCDGPLFKGKRVAVIGGGNSGIEAAIDLAGIVSHVTVLEFAPELKCDKVLEDNINKLNNVTVLKNVETKEITGDKVVNGLKYVSRDTNEESHIELEGLFIQIGLVPNTDFIQNTVDCNNIGEIIVDKDGKTNVDGIFAAGDCTDSSYKQIIISMGSGATAALSAFDYLIRK